MVKILFLGEIIGIPTVKEVTKNLSMIIDKYHIDTIIANADGGSDGYGLLSKTAYMLHKFGVDIITTGDLVYNKKDVKTLLKFPFLLRPFNIPSSHGGRGSGIFTINHGIKVGVISILGRVNFNKLFAADPFYSVDKALEKFPEKPDITIVDFHGGTTSEVQAMQWHLAGRVSMIVGSHLRILTTDHRIANEKTAIITGLGFCGGKYSIGGLTPDIEIRKIKNGQFLYSKIDRDNLQVQGVIAEFDEQTGAATDIQLLNEAIHQ